MTDRRPSYLLDTTVLSNFAHVRRPDLPRTVLGPHLAVTPGVLAELHAGELASLVPSCDWGWLTVLAPTAAESAAAADLERQLDPGEANAWLWRCSAAIASSPTTSPPVVWQKPKG